jgi:hypothetical protein
MAGKMRSPNYPALGLAQAVDAAQKLWTREKRTGVTNETAALAFGFKSLSGPARVTIGALRQYGLIEKTDKGHLRLSDRAVRILHGADGEKQKALAEAASAPKLFRELADTHLDASDEAIRSYLLTRKDFAEDGARKAIKAFRDTLRLAKPEASGYTGEEDAEEPEDMPDSDTGHAREGAGGKPDGPGVFAMTVPFAKGSIAVQVRVTGDAIKPAHLARVRKYLELAESDWEGVE